MFSNPSCTWKYITENEYNTFKSEFALSVINTFDVNMGILGPRHLKGNENLNLSAEQMALLSLYDPWGAKIYLSYKANQELTKSVFRILYDREPKYYSLIDGSWTETTNWTTSSKYSEADIYLTFNQAPLNLVQTVTIGLVSATIYIGVGEIAILAEGVSLFGLKNALTMWSYGTLSSTIAFQRGLNGSTNAANMADDVVNLAEGTWKKGWLERGNIIDDARGNGLGHKFPVVDKLEGQIAVSIKSLDTAATTYQKGSTLLSKLKSFANQLNNFKGAYYNGVTAYEGVQFTSKSLELVIPDVQLSAQQMQAIIDAKAYAQSLGIGFKIVVGR